MLEVKSFLKKDNKFIPVSDFFDLIPDPDYIEGAIEISKWNKKVLTTKNWDYVDELWSYFVEGIENVSKGKDFETYLPDQPTLVSFKHKSNSKQIVITVGKNENNSIYVEYNEFLTVMIEKAKEFFHHINRLLPNHQNKYKQTIIDLEVVEKNLNGKINF